MRDTNAQDALDGALAPVLAVAVVPGGPGRETLLLEDGVGALGVVVGVEEGVLVSLGGATGLAEPDVGHDLPKTTGSTGVLGAGAPGRLVVGDANHIIAVVGGKVGVGEVLEV